MPRALGSRTRAAGLLLALAGAGWGTQPVPLFTRDGIGAVGRSASVLAPGMVLMLYGGYLAGQPVCGQPTGPGAREFCGVRVLLGDVPAQLLYVSAGQINFKIPPDAPAEGFAPLRVCVESVCSAPVPMFFSRRTARLSIEKPASVYMPVWVRVDPPPPYSVAYPCGNGPWVPAQYEFEVRRGGLPLAPLPQPPQPRGNVDCAGPNARSSLPLHLLYRFDEPGVYAVRLTVRTGAAVLYRSAWTDIPVAPSSEAQRARWLQGLDVRDPFDTVPSLLAWPDEQALAVLLRVIPPRIDQCANFDCLRLAFGRAALAWFDDSVLRAGIPPDRLAALRAEPLPPIR